MAERKLQIKYSTEGFAETISALRNVGTSFDQALSKAKKAASEAAAAGRAAAAGGDIRQFEAAESARVRAANQANRAITQAYRELGVRSSSEINQLKSQAISAFEALKNSGVASARDIGNAQVALNRRLQQLDSQLEQMGGSGGGFTVLKGAMSSFLGGAALNAVGAIQNALGGLSRNVIETGASAERQAVAFETFLGSAEKAQKLIKEVREFAATTPFELPEVTEAAKTLLAKGVEAEAIIPSIRRLGEIAAGADKPLNQLLFVYGQIKDQGKAFGQDLNQLTNAGISIGDIAKALGISQDEVRKFVSEGKFGFEELEKTIVSVTSEGGRFNGLMDKLGGTTAVKLSNVNDSFTKIYQAIYDGVSPALATVLDTVIEVINPLGENERLFAGINQQAEAFREWIKGNPQIVDAIAKSLEDGVEVAMTSIAGLAKTTLEFLQKNPDAIANTIQNLGTLLQGMGKFLELINLSLSGWGKIGAAITAAGTALAQATGNFDYNTNTNSSKINERLTPELFNQLAGELGVGGAEISQAKKAISQQAQEKAGGWAKFWKSQEYFDAYDQAARAELYRLGRERGVTDLIDFFRKAPDPGSITDSGKKSAHGLISPIPGATSSNKGGYAADSGLDLSSPEKTPVVSVAGGTLVYAERGHTSWTEDAAQKTPGYQPPMSVLIKLDQPVQAFGKTANYAYYTHLMDVEKSILNKGTDRGVPLKIQAGQALGKVGTANNVPHLHLGLVEDRGQTKWFNYDEVHELIYGTRDTSAPANASKVPEKLGPQLPPGFAQTPRPQPTKKPASSALELNEKDFANLLLTSMYESDGVQNRTDVALSIINRLKAGRYGKSATDVVFAPGQYEPNFGKKPVETVAEAINRYAASKGISKPESAQMFEQLSSALRDEKRVAESKRFLEGATDFRGYPLSNSIWRGPGGNRFLNESKDLKRQKKVPNRIVLAGATPVEYQTEQIQEEDQREQRQRAILEQARSRTDAQRQQQQDLEKRQLQLQQEQAIKQFELSTAKLPAGPLRDLRTEERGQLDLDLRAKAELLEIQQGIQNLELQRDRKIADQASGEATDPRDITAEIDFLRERKKTLEEILSLEREIANTKSAEKITELSDAAGASARAALEKTQSLSAQYGDLTDQVRRSDLERSINEQFAPYKDGVVQAITQINDLIIVKSALGQATEKEAAQLEDLKSAYLEIIRVQQQAGQSAFLLQQNSQQQESLGRELEEATLQAQIRNANADRISAGADPFLDANRIRRETALMVETVNQKIEMAKLQERILQARSDEERQSIQRVIDGTQQLNQLKLDDIRGQYQTLGDVIAGAVGDALQGFWSDLRAVMEGTKSLGDAILSFFSKIFEQIAQFFFQQGLQGLIGGLAKLIGGAIGGGVGGASGGVGGVVGGLIGGFAEGGLVRDRVGLVSQNEFVLRAAAVNNLGLSLLRELNQSGRVPQINTVDFGRSGSRYPQSTPAAQINMTVLTPDANSFRKSETQIGRQSGEMLRRSLLRNS